MERSTQGTSDQSLNSFQWASLCSELAKCWCVIIDWTLPRRGPRKTKARGQLNLQSRVLKISQQHSLTFISHTQVCLSMTDTEQMHTIRPVHHSCLGRFFVFFTSLFGINSGPIADEKVLLKYYFQICHRQSICCPSGPVFMPLDQTGLTARLSVWWFKCVVI